MTDKLAGEIKHTGFTGLYEVTPQGQVFSHTNWRGYGRRQLVQRLNASGYPSVRLVVGGRRWHVSVHRLVATGYLPDRPSPSHEIRHLDGDRTNCVVQNLAWGTQADNAADRARHGRTSCGARHSRAIRAGLALSKARGER